MAKALEKGSKRKAKARPVAVAGRLFTRQQELVVKRLYLVEDVSPKEIAEKFGLTSAQVSNFLWHRGWSQLKKSAEAQSDSAREIALEAVKREQEEFVASVVNQAQEMTELGFSLARESATGPVRDAIQFSAALSGAERAVRMVRQAWQMDAKQQAAAPQMITLNLLTCQPGELQQAEVVDVETAPEIELDLS